MIIPSGIIIMYIGSNSSISGLAGWSRNTDFDGRYVQGTANGTNPAGNAGASTHTHAAGTHTHGAVASHTHGGSSGPEDSNGCSGNTYNGGWNTCGKSHTHSYTLGASTATAPPAGTSNWGTATNDAAKYTIIFLESDGTPIMFPDDTVTWLFAASNSGDIPAGFSHHTASVAKFFIGAATNADGGTGTSGSTHTHGASSSHTHGNIGNHDHADATSTNAYGNQWTNVWKYDHGHDGHGGGIGYYHNHTASISSSGAAAVTAQTGNASGAQTATPPNRKLTAIVNDSGAARYDEGLIVLWDGALSAIPLGWNLCDGSEGTPDMRDKFALNTSANEAVNGTGGATGHPSHSAGSTHTHTSAHGHTVSLSPHPNGHYGDHNGEGGGQYPVVSWSASDNVTNAQKGHVVPNPVNASPQTGTATTPITDVVDSRPPFRYVAFLSSPASESGQIGMFGSNF